MLIHINREEITQLPTDRNEVSSMDKSMSNQMHDGVTKYSKILKQ